MSIYTVQMWKEWMKEDILTVFDGGFVPRRDQGIRFLEEDGQMPGSDYLYAAAPEAVRQAVRKGTIPEQGALIFISRGEHLKKEELAEGLTVIETDLTIFSLYNRLQEHLHRFHLWDQELQRIIYTNGGLQKLLEQAAQLIDTTLLLVNAGYKHMASVYHKDVRDATADELRENGYQSFDSIHSIRHETPIRRGWDRETSEFVEYISSMSGNYTMIRLIHYQGYMAARLAAILNGAEANPCYSDLLAIVSDYVAEYMFSNQGADYGANASFGMLVADLIEHRLTDPDELEQRLRQIKLATRRYYHVMLIGFGDSENRMPIPWNYIISQLEHIFPFSNITTYKGEILLIIRKMKRGRKLKFDQDGLMKIMEMYNGYACIGNTSEFLISLPPVYHQAHDALRLGRVMDPAARIFYYEDYSVYETVELAATAARQLLGSRNLVHLCNNEIIALVMYDKKYGTNMVEVLKQYLLHERNTSEAAKALYIHRNTMLYKIHKIEEIMGCGLDDPMLRERLLFSCRVLEYMTRYCGEDILVLKRNKTDKKAERDISLPENGEKRRKEEK